MTYLLAIAKAFKIVLTHHLAKKILKVLTGENISTATLQERLTFTEKKAGRGLAKKAFEAYFKEEDIVRLKSEWVIPPELGAVRSRAMRPWPAAVLA
jgi:hypothetical protein